MKKINSFNFVWALLSSIGVLILVWIIYKSLLTSGISLAETSGFVSIIVLIVTFFAILWYTLETKDLKELQKKQIDLSLTPVLMLSKRYINGANFDCLENIGSGVANNISIDDFADNSGEKEEKYVFKTSSKILGPGQFMTIIVKTIIEKAEMSLHGVPFIDFFNSKVVRIKINFENIEGDKFESILEIANSCVHIVKQSKVI